MERVELIHQGVSVDLPRVAEVSLLCFSVCPQLLGLPLVVSASLLLALQELEATSIRKSRFLWEEHGRMEQEAMMSRQVNELQRQLESAHHESQDWVVEVTGARATELLVVEQATTVEWGLNAVKVHLAETKAAL